MLNALMNILTLGEHGRACAARDAEARAARNTLAAQHAWRAASKAYQDAKARGDTRDQHRASRAVRNAAAVAIRAELNHG